MPVIAPWSIGIRFTYIVRDMGRGLADQLDIEQRSVLGTCIGDEGVLAHALRIGQYLLDKLHHALPGELAAEAAVFYAAERYPGV